MHENTKHQNRSKPITVYTITIPDEGEEATLLVKKGNLAHLLRFNASSREEMLFALLTAQSEIEALEANPPQVEVPSTEAPIATSKDKSAKTSKPKKKKVSLDDIPEGELNDSASETEQTVPTPQTTTSLHVGDTVNLPVGAVDTDGDPVPFQQGRIVELETERMWLESLAGEQDAWGKRADLLAQSPLQNASARLG